MDFTNGFRHPALLCADKRWWVFWARTGCDWGQQMTEICPLVTRVPPFHLSVDGGSKQNHTNVLLHVKAFSHTVCHLCPSTASKRLSNFCARTCFDLQKREVVPGNIGKSCDSFICDITPDSRGLVSSFRVTVAEKVAKIPCG